MKRITNILLIAAIVSACGAEEQSFPSLKVPTGLESFQLEAALQQRFRDKLNDNSRLVPTFFTVGSGANTFVGLRFLVWSHLEFNGSYESDRNEFAAGGSYALLIPSAHLRTQLDGSYYTREDPAGGTARSTGVFCALALETDPLFTVATPAVTGGYDFLRRAFGLGLGLDIGLLESVAIFGEYLPVVDPRGRTDSLNTRNVFSFGLKIVTTGHQFFLFAGNSTGIGEKNNMWGAPGDDLHLGFVIKRVLDFH